MEEEEAIKCHKEKNKLQNKIKNQRYRDTKKADTIMNSQISKCQKISLEEEHHKEENKQKMQRYRDKKRAIELIYL